MPTPGTKPIPPSLRLLSGRSPGRDSGGRKVKTPPAFVRVAPAPPTWMSREAKAEWRRVVPELERLKLVKQAMRGGLAAYCETWAVFVRATRQIHVEGVTTIGAMGGMVSHPAVTVARAASKDLRSWCAEFGLTPSAEGRLSVPEQQPDDGDDGFD